VGSAASICVLLPTLLIAACHKLELNSWSIYLPERSEIMSVELVVEVRFLFLRDSLDSARPHLAISTNEPSLEHLGESAATILLAGRG
jgi:hypothetical protein